MNALPATSHIVNDAKRSELVKAFCEIIQRNPGYYGNLLRGKGSRLLSALKRNTAGVRDPAKLKKLDQIERGTKFGANKEDFGAFVQAYGEFVVSHALGTTEEQPKLELPINMIEQVASGDVHFYRAFGGKAGAEGVWWMAESELVEIVSSSPVRTRSGRERQEMVRTFMLSSSFVHPRWNAGKHVARLTLPAGLRMPILVGMGSWRTTAADHRADSGKNAGENLKLAQAVRKDWGFGEGPDAKAAYRVMRLGMLPRTGPKQWYVPLFEKKWIQEIPDNDPKWPFGS